METNIPPPHNKTKHPKPPPPSNFHHLHNPIQPNIHLLTLTIVIPTTNQMNNYTRPLHPEHIPATNQKERYRGNHGKSPRNRIANTIKLQEKIAFIDERVYILADDILHDHAQSRTRMCFDWMIIILQSTVSKNRAGG